SGNLFPDIDRGRSPNCLWRARSLADAPDACDERSEELAFFNRHRFQSGGPRRVGNLSTLRIPTEPEAGTPIYLGGNDPVFSCCFSSSDLSGSPAHHLSHESQSLENAYRQFG